MALACATRHTLSNTWFDLQMTIASMAHDAEAQFIPPGLQVEIYPGTEVMRDFEGSHFTHSHNDREGMVLVPQPSHSPDDPLVNDMTVALLSTFGLLAAELVANLEMDCRGY
jgi:hypothetical protein